MCHQVFLPWRWLNPDLSEEQEIAEVTELRMRTDQKIMVVRRGVELIRLR
jgi:hypothetical protein